MFNSSRFLQGIDYFSFISSENYSRKLSRSALLVFGLLLWKAAQEVSPFKYGGGRRRLGDFRGALSIFVPLPRASSSVLTSWEARRRAPFPDASCEPDGRVSAAHR